MKTSKLAIFQTMEKLNGKTIWITGASSGIGKELALQLAELDCKLIISARRENELLAVKNRCAHPGNVSILPLDLIKQVEMPLIAKKAWETFNGVDILINNAGISQRSLIANTTLDVYKKLMDINYLGTIALTKAVLPYFIENEKGYFVTITSLMGKFGSPYRSGYCGAKHALHGFFDVLRMEHEKDNIDVTLICPGFVQTNVAKNALTADGNAQNIDDEKTQNGLTTVAFSKQMIKAMQQRKFEAYIGKSERFGIYLKRFFPKLLHKIVMKSAVR